MERDARGSCKEEEKKKRGDGTKPARDWARGICSTATVENPRREQQPGPFCRMESRSDHRNQTLMVALESTLSCKIKAKDYEIKSRIHQAPSPLAGLAMSAHVHGTAPPPQPGPRGPPPRDEASPLHAGPFRLPRSPGEWSRLPPSLHIPTPPPPPDRVPAAAAGVDVHTEPLLRSRESQPSTSLDYYEARSNDTHRINCD
ncbi:unnamed protein product [Lampetra planeri]